MVLVQKREPLVPLLVKELKQRNIDVVGSDRIVLPQFPAIRDMLNLMRFCINNRDDFNLCCTLKSPIYRLTELDIFNLCKIKNDKQATLKSAGDTTDGVSVFDVLQDTYPQIHKNLTEIVNSFNTFGPYTFFTQLLNNNNVREQMVAALGNQIIDPLEEFLSICLAYERTAPGTNKHFLKWFVASNSEIKRDMDASTGVRIVTVHGSKGLEAPVIFLIDTVRVPNTEKICRHKGQIG